MKNHHVGNKNGVLNIVLDTLIDTALRTPACSTLTGQPIWRPLSMWYDTGRQTAVTTIIGRSI